MIRPSALDNASPRENRDNGHDPTAAGASDRGDDGAEGPSRSGVLPPPAKEAPATVGRPRVGLLPLADSTRRSADAALAALARHWPTHPPLLFFDLETTGLRSREDRVVEVAWIRLGSSEDREPIAAGSLLIHPGVSISRGATRVHGITNADVRHAPSFTHVAPMLAGIFGAASITAGRIPPEGEDGPPPPSTISPPPYSAAGTWADGSRASAKLPEHSRESPLLAGYNVANFDIPLLHHEFARTGHHLGYPLRKALDVLRLFRVHDPHPAHHLSAAVAHYLGRSHDGAHRALADVEATVAVFAAQLTRHPPLGEHIAAQWAHRHIRLPGASPMGAPGRGSPYVGEAAPAADLDRPPTAGMTATSDGRVRWGAQGAELAFGRHRGESLRNMARHTPSYLKWMLKIDLAPDTTRLVYTALAVRTSHDSLSSPS